MYQLLKGMRIVEASSFVASPTAGLYCAQMGAEVIRIDQIGGGPDFHRWPRAASGSSLYWEGLNKAKRSVALDLASAEGRELMAAIVTAPGDGAGLFVTNYPVAGFLSHERLAAKRADLITVRIMGQANGGPALDYTVNCALGIPQITGPASLGDEPVNHVLPAWDLLTGAYAAFALVAAERERARTRQGREVRIPLADVGIATIANLGQLAEVLTTGADRARYGNEVYGAFGRDFVTLDGARLMVMAITPRQWIGLVAVLGIGDAVAAIEAARGVTFAKDESVRFESRDLLYPLVAGRICARTAADLGAAFDANGCCWGRYHAMHEAVADPALVGENPIFSLLTQPSGETYPVPGAMATIPGDARIAATPAPRLGADTEQVLAEVLGLPGGAVGDLVDRGVAAVG